MAKSYQEDLVRKLKAEVNMLRVHVREERKLYNFVVQSKEHAYGLAEKARVQANHYRTTATVLWLIVVAQSILLTGNLFGWW